MNPVSAMDLVSLLATLTALVLLAWGRKRAFRQDTRWLLAGMLALTLFDNFSNILEWTGITDTLDIFEDYIGVLLPFLWGVFFYAVLREGAEQDLRESEARFRSLFEQSPDGVLLLDPHDPDVSCRIVDCNHALCRMTGYHRDELIGRSIDVLHEPEEPMKRAAYLERLRRSGAVEAEGIHRRKDGSLFPVHSSTGLIAFHGKELILGVHRDITERRQIEAERETLIAELEVKNVELERFAYTVSHDLKSPLITIQGFLNYLERDASVGNVERMRADITRISNAAQTMQELLDELLELSRVGRIVNPPEKVPLGELAREAVDTVAGRLTEGGVEVEIAPNLPIVYGDRPRLREVLENLLDNAVKFMGDQPQPRVEIGVRRDDHETVFYVRDNGVGIDPRYHEKVFGLFEKLDPKTEGTGVGLAIVQRIVDIHGGRIWVESEGVEQGTSFCFTLPGCRKTANDEKPA
jgi:two-component system sensor kinase FixL